MQDATRAITNPTGVSTSITQAPDPRFGMEAPLTSQQIVLPSTLTSTTSLQRAVTLSDPSDPLSLTALTDTRTVKGRVSTSSYSAATHTITDTTPAGRQTVRTLGNAHRGT